ncbi:CD109 antigen [Brachionichthys hirsutus]|uniref:CD109 antigen n=1 Tax=Brachionichthys hirsutus TaxID=412623 RepID=UPI0036044BD8
MEPLQVFRILVLILPIAAQNVGNSPDPASYLLLTPKSLRPGVQTAISVTVLTESPVQVSADIIHGGQMVASAAAPVEGGWTGLLTLPPIQETRTSSRLPYMLEVKGHRDGILVFSNSTRLMFNHKNLSTFIQTDRRNYRPGQEVKIRAVSIGPGGKPSDSPVDLVIKDPKGNRLRQWLNVTSTLGAVSRWFQLSQNPPLGQWTIIAIVNNLSTEKHFNVDPYVLPKFEVLVKVPTRVHREDYLSGSVSAKYSYGKAVLGRMNLTFFYNYHGVEEVFHDSRDEKIDGSADFMVGVPNYEMLPGRRTEPTSDPGAFVTVVARVTEDLSGLSYSSTAKVCLTTSRYKMSLLDHPPALRPALTFTATLKIRRYDGHLPSVDDQLRTVQVKVVQMRKNRPWSGTADVDQEHLYPDEMVPENLELPVPADGLIPLHIWIRNDTQRLTVKASFEDSHAHLQLNRMYTSPSQSYLQIHGPPSPLRVGSPVELQIESSFPTTEIHYVVKSRGQVVSAGTSSGDLSLVPEASWAPMACIIVFCVHDNGEIINDVIKLSVSPALRNQVSLDWSHTMVAPAADVRLRVKVAEPASLVGILVVDKASQGAGSGNDITQDEVLKALMGYSDSEGDAPFEELGLGDPYSVFKACDLMALTDASLPMTMKTEYEWEVLDQDHGVEEQQEEQQQEQQVVRDHFPETWVWMDTNTGASTTAELDLTAPDSITTWVASAFVMSRDLGLGLVEAPEKLVVFRDFFMSFSLPACIVRGEELLLEIILFNYLQEDLQVSVTVSQSASFEFVLGNEIHAPGSRRAFVASQRGASVLIPIRPLVLGDLLISVDATSPMAFHRVLKTVLVKAEGLEQTWSTSLLLEPLLDTSVSRNVMFTFPAGAVAGSQRVSVAAVGDILGPSISGLESLIQLPRGCGEQNMINFAPNIYVLWYLTATGGAEPDTTNRAVAYMIIGYEQELSFQRADGSFSAFGEGDQSGSTWLTAFVLKCFLQARPFVDIDPNVIHRAAAYLGAQQGADGRFIENGRVIHSELKGGQDSELSLTAYVLIALQEDADIGARYSSQVSLAVAYLDGHLQVVASNYSLALLTYALTLFDHAQGQATLLKLMERADVEDGVPMWSSSDDGLASSWQPRSAGIEMVSYLLLSQHSLGLLTEGIVSAKWLSKQRNHLGGYGSTQDTIVALQALSMFAGLIVSQDINATVRVDTAPSAAAAASFHIHRDNSMIHQSQQIEPQAYLDLQVTAEGRGLVLFQVNVFYNIRGEELTRRRRAAGEHGAFRLIIKLFDSEENSAHLYVCTSLWEGLSLNATGMAIMEVGLLSGFSLPPDAMATDDVVKKVETQQGKVILYLDSVTREEICLLLPLVLEQKVAKVQEATVIVFDYYEPRRRSERSYNSHWRSNMTSKFFCGEDNRLCKDDPQVNAGSRCSHGALVTGLLFIVFHIVFIAPPPITCGLGVPGAVVNDDERFRLNLNVRPCGFVGPAADIRGQQSSLQGLMGNGPSTVCHPSTLYVIPVCLYVTPVHLYVATVPYVIPVPLCHPSTVYVTPVPLYVIPYRLSPQWVSVASVIPVCLYVATVPLYVATVPYAIPVPLYVTPVHLYVTTVPYVIPVPIAYVTPVPLYVIPVHLYVTPVPLYVIPVHLYVIPVPYVTPVHLYVIPVPYVTPVHLYVAPVPLYVIPVPLYVTTVPYVIPVPLYVIPEVRQGGGVYVQTEKADMQIMRDTKLCLTATLRPAP